jgi:single-strand DNA-binding protein
MRETYMHVAGVVATDPTIRKFDDGRQVLSFRVASTSRRYDTNSRDWVDGPTLWVKVSCWRELATNASESVRKRDRVVVWGRVRTEQWKGEDGGQRSDLALEAESLGHDLAFGTASFMRRHRTVSTRTLTADGVLDMATGELTTPEPGDLPELPAGIAAAPDLAAAQAAAAPLGANRPEVPADGDLDADVGADLDDELDDEQEELDERAAVLASA